jgi:ribosomal protein L19E
MGGRIGGRIEGQIAGQVEGRIEGRMEVRIEGQEATITRLRSLRKQLNLPLTLRLHSLNLQLSLCRC